MSSASRALVVCLAALGIMGTALPALAQPDAPAETVEAARADFAEGQGHFKAKRWADALKAFERSYAAVASPNAQLMIARCLRELGRGPDAASAFTSAESEARRRTARGESKYGETAEAARAEGAAIRRTLGTLKIQVAGDAALTVDGKPVPLTKDGDAIVFHEPGSVQVSVKDSAGAEQRQSVVLTAGNTVSMEFGSESAAAPTPTPPPPTPTREEPAREPRAESPSWMLPAALVAGGVTLAGAGVFAGFGLSSRSTYDEIYERCGRFGTCTEADRPQADAGATSQTIANVGLGVAIVGVVATAVILYLGLTSPKVVAAGR